MNDLKKRIAALSLLACVALSSTVGCGSSPSSTSEKGYSSDVDDPDSNNAGKTPQAVIEAITNEKGDTVKLPVQSGEGGNGGITGENGMNLSGDDPQTIDSAPHTFVEVKDENGQPVTEVAPVTDANGESVTEAGGEIVTEYIPVTSEVVSEYQSKSEGRYILWMDISENKDYVFNDQFVKLKFKVKDDVPDGSYPITLKPDFSTIKGKPYDPDETINGSVNVGGQTVPVDVSGKTNFVLYGDNIGCKQGDTIEYYLNLKNNPGLAAILLWVYYDSNALEYVGMTPVGEFGEIADDVSKGKAGGEG